MGVGSTDRRRRRASATPRRRPGAGGHGDLVYTTFEVVDSERMRSFYGAVLGWEFDRGGVEDGWQIVGGAGGLQGGHERVTALPMWRVDDMAQSVAAVRDAGGTAGEPQTRPYGVEALCADDQGTRFYLGSSARSEASPDDRRPR